MKNFFAMCFLFGSIFLLAQAKRTDTVYLKKVTDYERTYKGKIGNEAVTIYVKVLSRSDCSLLMHTVKGWLYFNKNKKKIPVAGYYNGGLSLFHSDKNQREVEDYFSREYSMFGIESDSLKPRYFNISLTFKYDGYHPEKYPMQGTFSKNGKKIKSLLYKKLENNVYRENEYLILPNGKSYNTFDIIDDFAGHTLLSASLDKKEYRVLLQFKHMSSHSCNGRCATDIESGYRVLVFTKDWKLKGVRTEFTDHCDIDYTTNTKIIDQEKIKKYQIEKNGEILHYLNVNLKNSTISIENSKK